MNPMLYADENSESFVVGCCLMYPDQIDIAFEMVPDGDMFLNATLGPVYDAAVSAYNGANGKLDTALMLSECSRRGLNTTESDLVRLMESFCPPSLLTVHLETIRRCHRVRSAHGAILDASFAIERDPESIDGTVGELMDRLSRSDGGLSAVHDSGDVAHELHREIMEGRKDDFIPTGYRTLDGWLRGGVRPGEVMVIGGRPGQGKTALGICMAIRACEQGHRAAFVSIEMSERQLVSRMRAYYGCPMNADQGDEEISAYAAETVAALRMPIVDLASGRLSDIRSHIRTLSRRDGIRVFVIDYLQLIKVGKEGAEEYQRVTLASQAIKSLAREYGVAIILLAQVNREGGKKQRPTMNDLKGSGSIEQDADQIVLIHNDPHCLMLVKHRNGRVGTVKAEYIPVKTRFEDRGEMNWDEHENSFDGIPT
jgi:replicative DNA helicase